VKTADLKLLFMQSTYWNCIRKWNKSQGWKKMRWILESWLSLARMSYLVSWRQPVGQAVDFCLWKEVNIAINSVRQLDNGEQGKYAAFSEWPSSSPLKPAAV